MKAVPADRAKPSTAPPVALYCRPMSLAAGTSLGPYEILAPLGAGGMGEVYRARDTRLGRDVAVKVIPSHLIGNPEILARFEREARLISSLNHPHICTLHDVGHQGGIDFLVMELVDGESLAERIARGPLPADQVLRIGGEIADALDKAHKQGLVHRDLKPGNVMLTKSGSKLLDFGLARATGLGPVSDLSQSPTATRPLTATGSIVGTFQYMAPEQLDGGDTDARTDLWALGVLLYEMATGHKAFTGKSQASLIGSIMKDEPRPISEVQPLAPPGLDRLVKACLAKDPDERIQTAHDVKLQLRWIVEGGSQAGVPAPVAAHRRGRERLAWILAASFAALAFVLAAVVAMQRGGRPPRVATRFEIATPATLRGMSWPRISPDGRTLAFLGTDSTGRQSIWMRPLGSLVANPLAGTEDAVRPFWSPDSRYLAYFAGDQLKKIAIAGGPPQLVCEAKSGFDGSWGTRGIIVFDGSTGDSIRQVPASGGVPSAATKFDRGRGDISQGWPWFMPDGRHFVYNATRNTETSGGQGSRLMLGKLGSLEAVEIGSINGLLSRVEYCAGHLLFATEGVLMARPFDERRLRFTGEPFPIAERVAVTGGSRANFSVSRNGVLALMTGLGNNDGQFVWVDRAGRELEKVGPAGPYRDFALSGDGGRLAYSFIDMSSRNGRDIWVRDLRRDVTSRLTFDARDEEWPVWSPDGRHIAYQVRDPSSASLLLVKAADGSADADTLGRFAGDAGPEDWSADGRWVLIMRTSDGPPDVWAIAADGSREAKPLITEATSQREARLSPDGRWLAYSSNESGRPEIYVRPFGGGGGKWLISSRGGLNPQWRADGRELFYRDEEDWFWSVSIDPAAGFSAGTLQRMFQRPTLRSSYARNRFAVSRDGQRFLINASTTAATRPSFQVTLDWLAELRKP